MWTGWEIRKNEKQFVKMKSLSDSVSGWQNVGQETALPPRLTVCAGFMLKECWNPVETRGVMLLPTETQVYSCDQKVLWEGGKQGQAWVQSF